MNSVPAPNASPMACPNGAPFILSAWLMAICFVPLSLFSYYKEVMFNDAAITLSLKNLTFHLCFSVPIHRASECNVRVWELLTQHLYAMNGS